MGGGGSGGGGLPAFGLPLRLATSLFALLGALALLLAGVGIHAAVRFAVARRRREMGIRLALGARTGALRRRIVGGYLATTAVGVVLGGAAVLLLGRPLAGLPLGVPAADPLVLAAVATVLALVTWLAADLPARRAASVDVASVLRED